MEPPSAFNLPPRRDPKDPGISRLSSIISSDYRISQFCAGPGLSVNTLMRSDRTVRLGPLALAGLHITRDSPEQPQQHLSETNIKAATPMVSPLAAPS